MERSHEDNYKARLNVFFKATYQAKVRSRSKCSVSTFEDMGTPYSAYLGRNSSKVLPKVGYRMGTYRYYMTHTKQRSRSR